MENCSLHMSKQLTQIMLKNSKENSKVVCSFNQNLSYSYLHAKLQQNRKEENLFRRKTCQCEFESIASPKYKIKWQHYIIKENKFNIEQIKCLSRS